MRLYQIEEEVRLRAEAIASAHSDWPCRKGCDDCCRSLASVPRVSPEEWRRIDAALSALPAAIGSPARRRIRDAASSTRPVVCPLLDTESGSCLVYEARPVACRAYGFYAECHYVLGCHRIEAISRERPDVVWGNHAALEQRVDSLGPAATFSQYQ